VRVVVNISNVVDANCCLDTASGAGLYLKADLAQYVNGEHTLEYVSSCLYQKTYTRNLGDYGDVEFHNNNSCTDLNTTDQFDELVLIYNGAGTIWVYADGDALHDAFYWSDTVSAVTCLPGGSVNNELTACGDPPHTVYNSCGSGSATVVAG
jgi:hypothetical protein